ncbi:hypothetical protein [Nonomuraea sp. LPB2021202275-12-8]|uniref:hypothetical protein n=1 Tax=Nonomuraea sp. LPB2021202275-12-8 TaxID=3120159 RepID=UPI00300DB8AF
MNVLMLPGGTLRVPTVTVLDDGTRVHGTRDVPPDTGDYDRWLPFADDEERTWHAGLDDEAILSRWQSA